MRRDAVPEGDILHRAAHRVGTVLTGRRLLETGGTHPAMTAGARRLRGRTVTAVEAIGKHLLIHVEGGWTLRTHLGMSGRWVTVAPHAPWPVTPGKARVVLRTADAFAICFAAPTVEIGPTEAILSGIAHLGPDLAAGDVPLAHVVERARLATASTVADLLLDQSVASGIGNVYKSEVLFLERTAPATAPAELDDHALAALYTRACRLLSANISGGARTTTGTRSRDGDYWVYGRNGQPCRRCGTPIVSAPHGRNDRITYWCPRCQPQRSAISRNRVNG